MGVFLPGAVAWAFGSSRSALATRLAAGTVRAFTAEHDRWILWLPVLIATGIGVYFSLPAEPMPWLGLTALTGIVALCLAFRHAAGSGAYLGWS